jgi:hypothetical protein
MKLRQARIITLFLIGILSMNLIAQIHEVRIGVAGMD